MSLVPFFNTSRFAVVGASSNPTKFGYKVMKWYSDRSLPVTPINPKGDTKSITQLVTSLAKDKNANKLSISVITPPHVSSQLIDEIVKLKSSEITNKIEVVGIWFQPGAYDSQIVEKAKNAGINCVIANDHCILVEGDGLMAKL